MPTSICNVGAPLLPSRLLCGHLPHHRFIGETADWWRRSMEETVVESLSTGQGRPYYSGGFRQRVGMTTRGGRQKLGPPHIATQEKTSEHSTQVKQPCIFGDMWAILLCLFLEICFYVRDIQHAHLAAGRCSLQLRRARACLGVPHDSSHVLSSLSPLLLDQRHSATARHHHLQFSML